MKILFVTHSFPFPIHEGIKLMSYHLLKELSLKDEIHLLSLAESEDERKYIPEVQKFVKTAEIVPHKINKSAALRVSNVLFGETPFCVVQFHSAEFSSRISELAAAIKPDVIHFDFVNTSVYRLNVPGIPAVFFPHDAMSMLFYRNSKNETSLLKRLYYYSQYSKMYNFEKKIMKLFGSTAVVSPVDRDWLLKHSPKSDVRVIPNGVDSSYFSPQEPSKTENNSVIFRGIMDFFPNVSAAVYFSNKILPLIRKEIPEIRYYIAGKNPSSYVSALADRNTVVTGYVEDIREYMGRAAVNVCPMITGSGIKNKVLEAMAMAQPTVATTMACDGIPEVKDGENIMIADTPAEFAAKTAALLKNPELRKRIGASARKLVTEKYTWRIAADRFREVYNYVRNLRSTSL